VARRRSGEGENHGAGEKIRPTGGGSILKGSDEEGAGGVGTAWRRSGRERGREGGLGATGTAPRPRRAWAAVLRA
jgi:hypothetical protein